MIDLLLGIAIAFLLVRGWFRGFVREAMDLAGLVLGVILSFRLSPYVGLLIEDLPGLSRDTSRFVAGMIIFLVVGIGAAVTARALEKRARLPGLNLINRAWGAGLAGAWGLFVATLVLSLLAIAPLPAAMSGQLDDSAVTRTLTDPAGMPQQLFTRLSGDRIVQTLLNLRNLVGGERVVLEGEESLRFDPVDPAETAAAPAEAADVYDLLNRSRVEAGKPPLAWSDILADVAASHAAEMYATGVFSHRSEQTGLLTDRLAAAGIVYTVAGENLALAISPTDVHRGLMESEGHRSNILAGDFTRVGVAIVDGPLGLMTVEVFTG